MEYPITHATRHTLVNGLTLILDPDPAAPVISVQAWVATGSIHEHVKLGSGLSHFLEHMVFKGTRDFSSEELAQNVQAAGGHWNAYTTFDRTVYYIDGPSHSLEMFLKCLTGLVFFPLIPESEFESEKDVIRREIDMGLDDPDNASIRLLLQTAFTTDARRQPVIGHRHLFDEIAHSDLVSYHRQRYTPDRTHIVISGDFDAEKARSLVEEMTQDAKIVSGPEPHIQTDPAQLGPREAFEAFDIPSSRLCLSWKTPDLSHPDAAAYDLLAAILGRGKSSRLHRKLRDQAGLALEISAWTWIDIKAEGLFAVSAECPPENRDELKAAILREIAEIASTPLDEELAKAKRQTAVSQFRSLSTASGRASDLASNWHEARDLNYTRSYIAASDAITAADISRVAMQLSEKNLTYTSLDPLDFKPAAAAKKATNTQEPITSHSLSNGLRLALLPDRRVPLIHFQVASRAGAISETPETNGLNQLFASTITKGTLSKNADQIANTLESLGASISASAGNNALLVQAGGLSMDYAEILAVYADVILHPTFPDEAIAREKASQLASLEEALSDPLHRCFGQLRHSHFSGSGYGLDSLGSPESLKQIDHAALAQHHAKHFHANNLTLTVAGDFDPAELLPLLETHFSALPLGQAWSPSASDLSLGIEKTMTLPKKQAVLAIAFPGSDMHSSDRHSLAFLQEHASDMAGPLFGRIREELGLAYRVGASQFLGYDTGLFTFYLATSPQQLELARMELMKEIEKIATEGIPEETFERVRSTALSGVAIQQQSIASNARLSALDLLFGHPVDAHRELPEIYSKLSISEVRETARRLFSQAPSISIILGENAELSAAEG
jgi:zinc protease